MNIDVAPRPRRPHGTPFPVSPFAPLAHGLLLAGATAAVFLAGKPQEGAMGVFLLFAGAAMVICPPRIAVPWRLWAAAAGLTGCAALALLPERLLPQPAWRRTLETTPSIALPTTITTMPALTVFWLAVLAISLLTGLFLLAHPIRSRWLLVFALAAALAAGTYGALAIYAKETGWHYPFASDATFGFFPNRNHTASLLCVGSLLALGVLGVVLREERWLATLLAGGIIATCAAGLMFFSASRGGIVFLLAGIGCWIAGLGRQHRDMRLVVSFVAVLAAGGVLFLLTGGESRDRLLGKTATPAPVVAPVSANAGNGTDESGEGVHNLSTDFRLKIYRDTLAVIRDYPLCGLGLGTFPLVFPQYRQASLTEAATLHPESDWLMFAAEAGVPALLCLLILVVMAVEQLRAERHHAYWPLRWGCAVAAGAAALHGLVDVPWHRVQLGWWLLAVAGLALQSARHGLLKRSRVQHVVFVAGGLVALALGGMLVRAQWFGGSPLPPFRAEAAQAETLKLFKRNDLQGATNLARQAITVSPMTAPLYYQLGTLLLHDDDNDAEVDRVFQAQRRLNPIWTSIPLQQGDAWLSVDPNRTATLWLGALDLRRRIERMSGAGSDDGLTFYRQLLARTWKFPAARRALGHVAMQSPGYALAWLEAMGAEANVQDWTRMTNTSELLRTFSEGQRQRFLLAWFASSGPDAVGRFVGEHPDWQAAAWPVHLKELDHAGQYEAAVREAAAHYQIALDLNLPKTAEAGITSTDPTDESPLAAFVRYWQAGNEIAARRVLEEAAHAASGKPLTPEYWQTRLALAVRDHDWKTAWDCLKNYSRKTRPAETLFL